MKKTLVFIVFIFLANYSFGQKFGYIDSDFILTKMTEYSQAQAELDNLSLEWQEEIREMYNEIEGMYSTLKAEEVLLTNEMKIERTEEIKLKEEEVKQYQKKIFGFEGLFFLKKKELIKPIQDKIFDAVEKVCKNQRLAIMFDKADALVLIYTDPRHDYTDFVLDELGLGDPNDVIK